MAVHKFTFDVWPEDANERTLPLVVARWGRTANATLDAVKRDLRSGTMVTFRGHVRSECDPPHAGVQ